MANHKSSKKRILISLERRERNRLYGKTMRNALKKIRTNSKVEEVSKALPSMVSMIDVLAKKNVIHKNKAANLKSKLMRRENKLKAQTAS